MNKIGAIKDSKLVGTIDYVADSLCSYCTDRIAEADFLRCRECQSYIHITCLRHSSTPGDLLGDVFFEMTCGNCMQAQQTEPSTSSAGAAREKFVRQRMPWLMVITLALYNLSIKSKGLSHHGFFHWRSHIVSFIDKNWDYLFEPSTRRRKNWIGSISGSLSHNNPEFFVSGQETFNEAGWWKLAYANKTPRYVYTMYELHCQRRTQLRNEKRLMHEGKNYPPTSTIEGPQRETKRRRRSECESTLLATQPTTDSCSRTIPYMGRKPKLPKQLKIVVDDDVDKLSQQHQQQSLSSVQSSLMDFLAKNIGNDDLTLFNALPNMSTEPLKSSIASGRSDFLHPLIEDEAYGANHFFDVMQNFNGGGGCSGIEDSQTRSDIHASYDADIYGRPTMEHVKQDGDVNEQIHVPTSLHNSSFKYSNESNAYDKNRNEDHGDGDDDEKGVYQPRIIQVTNYQQLKTYKTNLDSSRNRRKIDLLINVKEEIESETEDRDVSTPILVSQHCNDIAEKEAMTNVGQTKFEHSDAMPAGKRSIFSKRERRTWPWLTQKKSAAAGKGYIDTDEVPADSVACSPRERSLIMMNEYEERQLLQKLRQIVVFDATQKKNIIGANSPLSTHIPATVRRLYRRLCVRSWKREHGRPLFNLDEQFMPRSGRALQTTKEEDVKIIDRYQIIALTSLDARRSFYARIAGSCQHELFESPYTKRILHPFIYRSKECFPPWLKLMCDIKYATTGNIPERSTIDYCYVRPNHIAAVNALLQSVFWPGIDMSECLSYPDFSVVAMYKRLVIGCGFIVPDVGFNEAYISFMAVRPGWQRSGIATFMLYHLIQTCLSKDITLHVSATNPAVMLYQKFGFKIEEIILNFYDKYLPIDSKHSRSAFFLRLMR